MDHSTSPGSVQRNGERRAGRSSGALALIPLLLALFAFFLAIDLLGVAFRLFGREFAETLIRHTANPFVGLFVGVLTTTLVQSSSTTTSMTVGLVGAGALSIEGAIPIIMGANIGTSVTNSLVSLAHVTRREEFQRAFAGATVHDLFNWMTVLILFPLELWTGYLARTSAVLTDLLAGIGGAQLLDPLKIVIRPLAEAIANMTGGSGLLTLLVAVILLFGALRVLVTVLKALMSERAERFLHRTLFRSAMAAVLAGTVMTVMVQSSSITTSVIVPLVAAGVVTLEQLFPFTIGANIGTTVTAILAALATGNPDAITIAFSHLMFNVTGMALVYLPPPIRAVPLALARQLGRLALWNRLFAAVYILVLFFLLPLLLLLASGVLLRAEPEPPMPDPGVLYWRQEVAPTRVAVRERSPGPTPARMRGGRASRGDGGLASGEGPGGGVGPRRNLRDADGDVQ
jgi:solute carrier family 34 (sodium-dependent phosphate cotransporter)